MAKYILRPTASEAPRGDDLILVHKELTFVTTAVTTTHTIETENVIGCVVTPHGPAVANYGEDACAWSVSGATLTITRGDAGTSALVVTVLYWGAPISA